MKKQILSVICSGVLLGLFYPSFPEIPTGILAWFTFVPILLITRNTTNFKEYLLLTLSAFIISNPIGFWWTALYTWKAFALCFVTQIVGIYLPFLLHFFLQKRFGWQGSLFLLPFHWTLFDALTHHLPHNLQMNYIAYTQANNIWLIQFTDFTGMWGITFWIVMMNVLITSPLAPRGGTSTNWMRVLAPPLGVGGLLLFYSLWVMKISPKSVLGNDNLTTKVSIIQTNADSYSQDSTKTQKVFDEIISLSDSAVRTAKPDLIILPEAAIPVPLFQDKNLLNFTKKAIASWQTSVAIGFVEYPEKDPKIYKNNALIFTPQLAMFWNSLKIKPEDVRVYQKEYGLPFVEVMPYCGDCQTLRGDRMVKGHEPYIFSYNNSEGDISKVALTICWEQMYPHKMAELVNEGADFVALMNNDAWFGTSSGAKQLLSFTRMRAIENRRSIVRCSNGGISCFIDPFGRITNQLPWFTSTIGTQEVLKVSKKSFYAKHPYFFIELVGVLFLVLFLKYELSVKHLKKEVLQS